MLRRKMSREEKKLSDVRRADGSPDTAIGRALPYMAERRSVMRVSSADGPSRSAKPGQRPVPLLT